MCAYAVLRCCPGSNAKPASCGELRPPPIKPVSALERVSVCALLVLGLLLELPVSEVEVLALEEWLPVVPELAWDMLVVSVEPI